LDDGTVDEYYVFAWALEPSEILELYERALSQHQLGDVNLDGAINGLDVDPFVDRVTSGTYQVEADMNEDTFVNGLIVVPFAGPGVPTGHLALLFAQ
jgi:hypothetical protein